MISPPLSRKRAATCIFINLLATPGLGSIFARRFVAGTIQLIFGLAGFFLTTGWILKAVYNSVSWEMDNTYTAEPNWIWELGTVFFCVSWLWSLGTSISLWREAAANGNRGAANRSAPPLLKLDDAHIAPALASIPDWQHNGGLISRTFQFKDFSAAMKFVNAVAGLAEEAWHHPDLDIRWNKVTLTLTTHDAGGLTENDFTLARRFDELSEG
jgi:4a-hydroxytetrahydrobiopterin dehydratase